MIIGPPQHLSVMFSIVVYKLTGNCMMTPGQHCTMRGFLEISIGIGFRSFQMVPGRLCMMRCRLLMIGDCFFTVRCAEGRLAFAAGWWRTGGIFA